MELAKQILQIIKGAGEEIMEVYNSPGLSSDVNMKEDNSPLTLADQRSHEYIMEKLSAISDYPIISEESDFIDFETRKYWKKFWLVDPLDGTKEFINRNGEFTVNIALIHNKKPILSVIYVPVKDVLYWADDSGAWKEERGQTTKLEVNYSTDRRVAVRSKSHASPEEEDVLERYNVVDSISVGSSLKFCMVAEGRADVYYRHGPTMEWDTAAGQAILQAAGGKVYVGSEEQEEFSYNKENLLNGSFLCLGF